MKKLILLPLLLTVVSLTAQTTKPQLKTAKDSASYAFGMVQAQRMKSQFLNEYDLEIVMAALRASLKNDSVALAEADAQRIHATYAKQLEMKAFEKNRNDGRLFLEQNKKRKEVTTTASGLQYEVLRKGTGTTAPTATDKVKVHYHGTLITGEVFDSSVDRGQTITFGLNQVIKGWTEGLQLMKVGDKFKFYIPYELAYGDRPAGAKIKPYSALIFEVELFEVNPKS